MKDFPSFCVAMVKDGVMQMSAGQKATMAAYLNRNEGNYVRATLSQPTKTRSTNQNSYYWGVVLTMIAEETKHTTEECHEFMKSMFLPREFKKIGGVEKEIQKSTTTLSTSEFEDYLEQIRAFAASDEELHLVIPLPNEVDPSSQL